MSVNKADISYMFNMEPKAAVEYMQNKGYQITNDWREMWQDAHAKAFTISKMTDAELLADSRNLIQTAIKEGWSSGRAERALKNMYQERGWWGNPNNRRSYYKFERL